MTATASCLLTTALQVRRLAQRYPYTAQPPPGRAPSPDAQPNKVRPSRLGRRLQEALKLQFLERSHGTDRPVGPAHTAISQSGKAQC